MTEISMIFTAIILVVIILHKYLRRIAENLESIKYNMLEENIKSLERLKKANYEMQGIIEDQRVKLKKFEHFEKF